MAPDGERITNGTVHWSGSGTNSFAAAWGQALDKLPAKDIKAATDSAGSLARGKDAARRGDLHQAFSSFMAAAEAGSAGAQNIVGYAYEHGIGVAADRVAAFRWYGQAAERESTWGLENASRFLREGLAGPADPAAADRLHAQADELRKRHTRFCAALSTLQAMQSLERKMYNDPNGQTLQLFSALATGVVMGMGVPYVLDAKAMDDRQRSGKFEVDLASDSGAFVCEALFLRTKASVQGLPGSDAATQLTAEAIDALANKFPSYVDQFSIAPEPGGICRLTLLPSAIELARKYSDIIPGRANAQKHADESLTWVGCSLE
jgi:TPR repeat protein